jgi:hypothetical protein
VLKLLATTDDPSVKPIMPSRSYCPQTMRKYLGKELLWCGSGRMFTTRWTRGLLLVGSMTRVDLHYYTQTEENQTVKSSI